MEGLKLGLAIIAGVISLLIALQVFGRWKWQRLTRALLARIESSRAPPESARFDARELNDLPAVVQRYFRTVLPDDARIISAASVEHTGSFNMGETVDQWKPFTSRKAN